MKRMRSFLPKRAAFHFSGPENFRYIKAFISHFKRNSMKSSSCLSVHLLIFLGGFWYHIDVCVSPVQFFHSLCGPCHVKEKHYCSSSRNFLFYCCWNRIYRTWSRPIIRLKRTCEVRMAQCPVSLVWWRKHWCSWLVQDLRWSMGLVKSVSGLPDVSDALRRASCRVPLHFAILLQ
jgi:hypothetical protein